MFVPCAALLYDITVATQTLKLSTTLLSISGGIRLSFLMMSSLVCRLFYSVFQVPPYKIVEILRMARSYWFDAKWVCPMGSYVWGIQVFCLRNEMVPYFSNRTLEYLRHNLPWDRLILHQTDNPRPSYSQDLNPPNYFLRRYLKEFVKTIHRQERTSSEEKSDGFHKKCSIELWTILMFELLLCCHTAAWCMERT